MLGAEETTVKRSATIFISAGAGLVLLAGGTTAVAAIAGGPVDGSGVIHGCWTNAAYNGTHVIVLQDARTHRPQGTTAISRNQHSPARRAGPAARCSTSRERQLAGPAGMVISTSTPQLMCGTGRRPAAGGRPPGPALSDRKGRRDRQGPAGLAPSPTSTGSPAPPLAARTARSPQIPQATTR